METVWVITADGRVIGAASDREVAKACVYETWDGRYIKECLDNQRFTLMTITEPPKIGDVGPGRLINTVRIEPVEVMTSREHL